MPFFPFKLFRRRQRDSKDMGKRRISEMQVVTLEPAHPSSREGHFGVPIPTNIPKFRYRDGPYPQGLRETADVMANDPLAEIRLKEAMPLAKQQAKRSSSLVHLHTGYSIFPQGVRPTVKLIQGDRRASIVENFSHNPSLGMSHANEHLVEAEDSGHRFLEQLHDAKYWAEIQARNEKRGAGCFGRATIDSDSTFTLDFLRDANYSWESPGSLEVNAESTYSEEDEDSSGGEECYSGGDEYSSGEADSSSGEDEDDVEDDPDELLDAPDACPVPSPRHSQLSSEDEEELQHEILQAERVYYGRPTRVSIPRPRNTGGQVQRWRSDLGAGHNNASGTRKSKMLKTFAAWARDHHENRREIPLVHVELRPTNRKQHLALRKIPAKKDLQQRDLVLRRSPNLPRLPKYLAPVLWTEEYSGVESFSESDDEDEGDELHPKLEPESLRRRMTNKRFVPYASKTGMSRITSFKRYLNLPAAMTPLQLVVYLLCRAEKVRVAAGRASPLVRRLESELDWHGLTREFADPQNAGVDADEECVVCDWLQRGRPLFGNWLRAPKLRRLHDGLLQEVLDAEKKAAAARGPRVLLLAAQTRNQEATTHIKTRLKLREPRSFNDMKDDYWEWADAVLDARPWRPASLLGNEVWADIERSIKVDEVEEVEKVYVSPASYTLPDMGPEDSDPEDSDPQDEITLSSTQGPSEEQWEDDDDLATVVDAGDSGDPKPRHDPNVLVFFDFKDEDTLEETEVALSIVTPSISGSDQRSDIAWESLSALSVDSSLLADEY